MVNEQVVVRLKTGLQARPAALFVQEANRYSAEIYVQKEDKKVNGKSIMGIMSLAVATGTQITIYADGDDETLAVSNLVAFVSREE